MTITGIWHVGCSEHHFRPCSGDGSDGSSGPLGSIHAGSMRDPCGIHAGSQATITNNMGIDTFDTTSLGGGTPRDLNTNQRLTTNQHAAVLVYCPPPDLNTKRAITANLYETALVHCTPPDLNIKRAITANEYAAGLVYCTPARFEHKAENKYQRIHGRTGILHPRPI